jgi:uncharacterized protein YcgL (UPF0745 family)
LNTNKNPAPVAQVIPFTFLRGIVMHCYIYKSLKKDELYLYLPKKDDYSQVPESLLKSLGQIEFVMELKLTAERKLARVDPNKVLAELCNKGFFIQMPPTIVPEALFVQNSKLH